MIVLLLALLLAAVKGLEILQPAQGQTFSLNAPLAVQVNTQGVPFSNFTVLLNGVEICRMGAVTGLINCTGTAAPTGTVQVTAKGLNDNGFVEGRVVTVSVVGSSLPLQMVPLQALGFDAVNIWDSPYVSTSSFDQSPIMNNFIGVNIGQWRRSEKKRCYCKR